MWHCVTCYLDPDVSRRTWNVGNPNAQWRHKSNLKEKTVTSSRNFETQVPCRALLHPLKTDSSNLEDETTISSRNTGSEVLSESALHPTKNGNLYYTSVKASTRRLEILATMTMKNVVFWDVTPAILVYIPTFYKKLIPASSTILMIEAAGSSDRSVLS